MNNTSANHAYAPSPDARSFSARPEMHVASAEELALISARLPFESGQSTEKVVSALDQFADALGFRATVFPRWGELTILINDGCAYRESSPSILVMQSTQDRTAQNAPRCLGGT